MPKSKYQPIIEAYCENESFLIPPGFYRHTPGHLAVVKKEDANWKLIATTWSHVADVINYLDHYCQDTECRIFNFEKNVELKRKGHKQLETLNKL